MKQQDVRVRGEANNQLELFPKITPERRAQLEYLRDWLLDGTELRRLEKLMEEAQAHPRKPKCKTPRPN
jgi:hypothetical protein